MAAREELKGAPVTAAISHEEATAEGRDLVLFTFPAGFDISTLRGASIRLPSKEGEISRTSSSSSSQGSAPLNVVRANRIEYERLVPLLPSSTKDGWRVGAPLCGAFLVTSAAVAAESSSSSSTTNPTLSTPPPAKRAKRRGEGIYELRLDDDVLGEETPQNSIPATPLAALKTRWQAVGATPLKAEKAQDADADEASKRKHRKPKKKKQQQHQLSN